MGMHSFTIEGISPLMMHSPAGMLVQGDPGGRSKKIPTPEEEAEMSAYRLPGGQLGFPAIGVRGAILDAARMWKVEKQRSSYKSLLAHIQLGPDELLGLHRDDEEIRDYEIDLRPVAIQKARIIRARPKLAAGWQLSFDLYFDETLFGSGDPRGKFQAILEDAGSRVGIGEFRPSKGGWYGRFKVID